DLQAFRQPPAGNTVENREIDGFGARTSVAIDRAEQFLRGAVMNILTSGKSGFQRIDIGNMRGKAQFNLAIVGGQYDIAGRGDKSLTDLPADFRADRNILQIWFGRRQPPGLRSAKR